MRAESSAISPIKSYIGRFCAIDIGTVTCRMLIADANLVSDGAISLSELSKQYQIVNLGEGVDATRRLSSAALSRTESALKEFIEVREVFNTSEHPIINTTCMATSASRDAKNSQEFENMMNDLGLELSIISGKKEASLSFAGASSSFPGEKVVVVDVGGGSTEVTSGIGGQEIEYSHSFDIGSRRITERFWDGYPCSKSHLEKARDWTAQVLASLPANIGMDARLIAVAGTATSVVTIDKKMREYDANEVNGTRINLQTLKAIEGHLASLDSEQLEEVVGLDPRRGPVIVGGLIILEEVMDALRVNTYTASESDILEGIVMYNAKQYISSN